MKTGKISSDGNRVNVGNSDPDGLNVNNYWDDNCNDNIGLASVRTSFSILNKETLPKNWERL